MLLWVASAWHLRARDAWIGWDALTRSRWLGLIVNNSRLLILEKHRAPNLATQVLGAARRALPIGLPLARAVVRVTRTSQSTRRDAPPAVEGVRAFLTSLDPGATSARRFLEIIRSHWGSENKNHWKRDAQWGEDRQRQRQRHRRRAPVLAIPFGKLRAEWLRGALLALLDEPCPQLFARCRRRPSCALRMIAAPLPAK